LTCRPAWTSMTANMFQFGAHPPVPIWSTCCHAPLRTRPKKHSRMAAPLSGRDAGERKRLAEYKANRTVAGGLLLTVGPNPASMRGTQGSAASLDLRGNGIANSPPRETAKSEERTGLNHETNAPQRKWR
jgi:hypothetical protein